MSVDPALVAYRELCEMAGRRRVRVTYDGEVTRVQTWVRGTRIDVEARTLGVALHRAVRRARVLWLADR